MNVLAGDEGEQASFLHQVGDEGGCYENLLEHCQSGYLGNGCFGGSSMAATASGRLARCRSQEPPGKKMLPGQRVLTRMPCL